MAQASRYRRSRILRTPRLAAMNLGKTVVGLATAPVRIGLAATETGLDVANGALGLAKRTLGEVGTQASPAHWRNCWGSTTLSRGRTAWRRSPMT